MPGNAKKIAPILFDRADLVREISERAFKERSDELLGCARMLPLALSETLLQFPVKVTFPDPPDIVFSSGEQSIAVEVSRVTWRRQSQVLAEARKQSSPWFVELDPALWIDKPARRGDRRSTRSADYSAIKLAGVQFDGTGSIGNAHRVATIDALHTAMEKKKALLNRYIESAPTIWLFLVDDGLPGAWAEILSHPDSTNAAVAASKGAGFERVYLNRFSEESPVRLA
jgi:hypothetical protein